MADTGYNGWKNYETWNVALWIGSEQGSYEYWREQTRFAWERAQEDRRYPSQTRIDSAKCILSAALKDEFDENQPELSGTYGDLLGAALSEVDWYEIAEHMLDDEEFTDAEEKTTEEAQ